MPGTVFKSIGDLLNCVELTLGQMGDYYYIILTMYPVFISQMLQEILSSFQVKC